MLAPRAGPEDTHHHTQQHALLPSLHPENRCTECTTVHQLPAAELRGHLVLTIRATCVATETKVKQCGCLDQRGYDDLYGYLDLCGYFDLPGLAYTAYTFCASINVSHHHQVSLSSVVLQLASIQYCAWPTVFHCSSTEGKSGKSNAAGQGR